MMLWPNAGSRLCITLQINSRHNQPCCHAVNSLGGGGVVPLGRGHPLWHQALAGLPCCAATLPPLTSSSPAAAAAIARLFAACLALSTAPCWLRTATAGRREPRRAGVAAEAAKKALCARKVAMIPIWQCAEARESLARMWYAS